MRLKSAIHLLVASAVFAKQNVQIKTAGAESVQISDPAFDGSIPRDSSRGSILDYRPVFNVLKGSWYGKGDEYTTSLRNNHPSRRLITLGERHQFVFPLTELKVARTTDTPALPDSFGMRPGGDEEDLDQLELRRRGTGLHKLYITLSVCQQPTPNSGINTAAPGLDLYLSSSGRENPGPGSHDDQTQHLTTEEGIAFVVDDFSEDVKLAVHAPALSEFNGHYTYELTASVDELYSSYQDFQSLYLLDRDHQAGLFITTNLTNPHGSTDTEKDAWMQAGSPFTLFAYEQNDAQIRGVRRSYCGLAENIDIHSASLGAESGMTMLGGDAVKQKFYLPGLAPGTSYHAILGLPSNYSKRGPGAPTGGGMVWRATEFQTNTVPTCQVISNLTFCDMVNYAVPNPQNGTFNSSQLAALYDNFASAANVNFTFSLQQIACDAPPDSQYSVATNCTNCAAAYKKWLCAVSIPRCLDPALNSSNAIPRNASDSSRNPMINTQINPLPYDELPPCGSLCFGLVQNCPAALQFGCPYPNTWHYNQSYGYQVGNSTNPTCNLPGAIWGLNTAGMNIPPIMNVISIVIFLSAILSSASI